MTNEIQKALNKAQARTGNYYLGVTTQDGEIWITETLGNKVIFLAGFHYQPYAIAYLDDMND